jgi:DNA-binding IclR family transcriptional regulator
MRTLVDAGLILGEGKTFRTSARLWRLLYLGLDQEVLVKYAQIVCDELARRLNETCYVVRLENTEVRTIARAVPDQGYRLHVVPGAELPGHAASSAKAILAFQPDHVVARVLREPLARLTPRTKTKLSSCLTELAKVRRDGFAVCDREIDENVMAYAVPVDLPSAGVLFSIGVTGPVSRLKRDGSDYYISRLRDAAAQFARLLRSTGREARSSR